MIAGSRWSMLRSAFPLVLALALPGAQAQVESHGVPASVLSPTSPGTAHAVPSSVTSPTPIVTPSGRILINGRHFRTRFGNPRIRHTRREFIPVPIFIPAYPITGDYSYYESNPPAEQSVPDDSGESSLVDANALNEAYNRGARDALARQRADSRYGEHYLDARERAQAQSNARAAEKSEASETAPAGENASTSPEPDNIPATVFI